MKGGYSWDLIMAGELHNLMRIRTFKDRSARLRVLVSTLCWGSWLPRTIGMVRCSLCSIFHQKTWELDLDPALLRCARVGSWGLQRCHDCLLNEGVSGGRCGALQSSSWPRGSITESSRASRWDSSPGPAFPLEEAL